MADEEIELVLPAQRPGDEVGGQRAIALIGQSGADGGKRSRQIAFCRGDGPQRIIRGHAGGGNHGADRVNEVPGAI